MAPHFGSSYARSEYPQLLRDEILEKYAGKKVDPKKIEKEIALETYALRAALFMIDGPEKGMKFVQESPKKDPKAKKKDEEDLLRIDDILEEDFKQNSLDSIDLISPNDRFLNYDRVMEVKEQLKKKGILEYAEENYGYLLKGGLKNEDGDPISIVPQEEMKIEGFLLAQADKLGVPEEDRDVLETRRTELKQDILSRSMTWREYWDFQCPNRGMQPAGAPFREKNESVYEYEASDSAWKLFGSMSHVLKGDGGKQMTREELDRIRELPIPKMMLRNKQTVEKLERGDRAAVTQDYQKTLQSFTFRDPEELKLMQKQADQLENEMRQVKTKAANTQEWRDLRYALLKFAKAENKEDAAKRSAEVLLAVESFTKGRKSEQEAETQRCVDMALKGISVCVPDAKNNPSVKPLVNRFNQVRGRHLFQKPIELEDYGTASALSPEKKKDLLEIDEEKDPLNITVNYGRKKSDKVLGGPFE